MKAEEIEKAFSARKLIDREMKSFDFEYLACTVASLREVDKLNIMPSLMMFILEKNGDRHACNYAEMIVFCLMPQPAGWENLIDHMNNEEISVTLKWLRHIRDYTFVENCVGELLLATNFFERRDSINRDGTNKQ